jgi:hypothetical protein
MKVSKYMFAQAIRFGVVTPAQGRNLYGRNIIRAFENQYGFLESPKTIADFDLAKGIKFSHGFFDGRIVIDNFKIYNNGIVVETKETTDDCVAIIADIARWAENDAGVVFAEDTALPELYLTHFEVELNINLDEHLRKATKINELLNEYMTSYKEVEREFKISGFSSQLDPITNGPVQFKFERRAGQPFSSNLYFSGAPLKTQDHINLLEVLEGLFTP